MEPTARTLPCMGRTQHNSRVGLVCDIYDGFEIGTISTLQLKIEVSIPSKNMFEHKVGRPMRVKSVFFGMTLLIWPWHATMFQ